MVVSKSHLGSCHRQGGVKVSHCNANVACWNLIQRALHSCPKVIPGGEVARSKNMLVKIDQVNGLQLTFDSHMEDSARYRFLPGDVVTVSKTFGDHSQNTSTCS